MYRTLLAVVATACLAWPAAAQTTTRPRSFVRAAGQGTVAITPDQLKVAVGVVTRASTAQQAADDNATRTQAVLAALRSLLGQNADIRTLNYSVNPVYGGNPSTITGFSANNSVEVTTTRLQMAGQIIDTATQAGANNIGALRFSLRDPSSAQQQALRLATMQARQQCEAIALGLGARLGQVISAEEASAVIVTPVDRAAGAAASTPIESGNVEVRANVIVEIEIIS